MNLQSAFKPRFANETPQGQGTRSSLRDVLNATIARRGVIIGVSVIAMAITVLVFSQIKPRYTAVASVMLNTEQKNPTVDLEAILSGSDADPATVENQLHIVKSRHLAKVVIDKLNLHDDPDFAVAKGGPLSWLNPKNWFASDEKAQAEPANEADAVAEEQITNFIDRVAVVLQGHSTVIDISYTGSDPTHTAEVANKLADEYVLDQLNARSDAIGKANDWLSEQSNSLADQLKIAEDAVEAYKAQYGLSSVDGNALIDHQIAELDAQLTTAHAKRVEAESKSDQTSGSGSSSSAVVQSTLIGQLREQEAELSRKVSELSDRYQPRHPEVVRANAELASIRERISEETSRIVESTHSDFAAASATEQELTTRLAELKGEADTQRQDTVGLRELERKATTIKNRYEDLLAKAKETQGSSDIPIPLARVLSTAAVPESPSFPKLTLVLALMVPASLMLGFLVAFVLDQLDNGFGSARQVEEMLGVPVLSTVPELKRGSTKGKEPSSFIVDRPLSSFAEGVRGVRTALSLSNVDKPPKVILVTSSVPGEGKTFLATGLARLAASSERVALIDLDLRNASVAKTLKITDAKGGIVEVLSGTMPLSEAMSTDSRTPLKVLSVKQAAISPPDLLNSQALSRLISALREEFDCVIIDCAPILPVNDTKLLLRHVDAVVFAVQWEKTPRDAVSVAIGQIRDAGAAIAGVVLTRTNMRRNAIYHYGYTAYNKYQGYYNA